jgi:hypothetical protein
MPRAVILYNFSSEENDELNLKKGECVNVLNSDEDWWECCDDAGNTGFAPFNYLRVMEEDQDEIPHGWEKFVDPETGDAYYFNEKTGEYSQNK